MRISLEKIKAMVLYFAEHTDPTFFGKTKLMKLFYFADFGYVKRHGVPMTFDNYKHLEHGPVPSTIYSLISSAHYEPDESLLSDTVDFAIVNGMHKIIPRKRFTESHRKLFTIAEMKMLGEVCQRFYSANKREIEDASHGERPWSSTEMLDDISYDLASEDRDSSSTQEEIKLAMDILK